ncbi:hypothetical protein C0J50_15358, partial [Silurus asotus]
HQSIMEVEDPISAKFQTIVEALMIKTTSEIVKVFTDVMLETRMEIFRSWREIDDLKQEMEQREMQSEVPLFRNQTTQVTLKIEEDEVELSQQSLMIPETTECRVKTFVTEPQVTQLQGRNKICGLSPDGIVSEHQTSGTETEMLATSEIQALAVVSPQPPPTSTTTTVRKRSMRKRTVKSKKKYMSKKIAATQSSSVTHTLRDRHLLGNQKPCVCCTSGQCTQQRNEPKNNSPVTSCGYTCKECGTVFQEIIEFETHKCPKKHRCSRCGQTFTCLKRLAIHNQHVPPTLENPFPYKCYLCDHMFATRCGWNIHKRIHAHGHVPGVVQQDIPSPSHSFTIPKELKTKVEVRLERISEAQLKAALFPKSSLLLDDQNNRSSVKSFENLSSAVEPASSTGSSNKQSAVPTINAPISDKKSVSNIYKEFLMECHASSSGTESSEGVRQSDDGTDNSVFPTASSKMQPAEKWTPPKSLIACRVDSVECEEGSSSASEDLTKGLNSLSRKRKISDCDHDIYNGVFPVEKVLRWRNTKGRDEVRIKWMPCSLCGAKWKNTWEPAESF